MEEALSAPAPPRQAQRAASFSPTATCETPEFQRPERADFYGGGLKPPAKPAELLIGEGYNHFEMLETLANPYGLLGRAVLAQMGLNR